MTPPRLFFILLMTGLALATISVMGSLQNRRLVAPDGSLIDPSRVALRSAEILDPAPGMLAEMGLVDYQVGS